MSPRFKRVLASGLLFTLAVSLLTPLASAAEFTEDFEGDTLGAAPTGNFYTWSGGQAGTGATNGVRLADGQKALKTYEGTNKHSFLTLDVDVCDTTLDGAAETSPVTIEYRTRSQGGPSMVTGLWNGRASPTSATTSYMGVVFTATDIRATIKVGATSTDAILTGISFALNTWYNVTLSGMSCETTGEPTDEIASVTVSITDGVTSSQQTISIGASAWIGGANVLYSSSSQHSVTQAEAFIDDIILDTNDGTEAGNRFCGNLADEEAGGPDGKWGYEYVSDDGEHNVQSIEDPDDPESTESLSMEDGFLFQGDDDADTWDYMAKHFSSGSMAFHTNMQIEAVVDGTNSVFRAVYSLENSAVPDATQRGNGLDTFLFDQTLEFQFKEVGNDWQIRGYFAHPLVNGGSRMAFGPAVNFGNPNDPTTFTFWADTRPEGDLFQENMGFSGGGTFYQGPHMAITVPDSNQPTGNRVIAYRALRDINIGGSTTLADTFAQDVIWTQWFVGYGDGRLGNGGPQTGIDAYTGLNDNKAEGTEDSQDSTCIFDDVGTSTVGTGGSGTTPGSEVEQPPDQDTSDCSSPFCVNADTVPEGFTVAAFNLFLGILMAAAIAAGFYSLGKSKIAMVIGCLIGLILAFTFGLMPLWPILVIVVVAVAFIFISTRGVGS